MYLMMGSRSQTERTRTESPGQLLPTTIRSPFVTTPENGNLNEVLFPWETTVPLDQKGLLESEEEEMVSGQKDGSRLSCFVSNQAAYNGHDYAQTKPIPQQDPKKKKSQRQVWQPKNLQIPCEKPEIPHEDKSIHIPEEQTEEPWQVVKGKGLEHLVRALHMQK
ncbi:hypothetical protein HAX54_048723 [Datura stramonium]|uniref:Uncharacterized protein n=1 Tax=Datura stramonium TaxID=4076 RepID=A0ABS8SUM1_DATST|nr:hypothetical protein [Datura stramonium]